MNVLKKNIISLAALAVLYGWQMYDFNPKQFYFILILTIFVGGKFFKDWKKMNDGKS